MKIIKITKRSRVLNELLDQAREKNVVIQTEDGEEFILAELEDFNREVELTRQNKKLMQFLDRRANEKQTVSLAEAKKQLGIG